MLNGVAMVSYKKRIKINLYPFHTYLSGDYTGLKEKSSVISVFFHFTHIHLYTHDIPRAPAHV